MTVQLVKDKSAVPDMSIAVTDKNDNYASGKTDKAGQITVPTGSGKTNEDGKVTTGYEDADGDRWTRSAPSPAVQYPSARPAISR